MAESLAEDIEQLLDGFRRDMVAMRARAALADERAELEMLPEGAHGSRAWEHELPLTYEQAQETEEGWEAYRHQEADIQTQHIKDHSRGTSVMHHARARLHERHQKRGQTHGRDREQEPDIGY